MKIYQVVYSTCKEDRVEATFTDKEKCMCYYAGLESQYNYEVREVQTEDDSVELRTIYYKYTFVFQYDPSEGELKLLRQPGCRTVTDTDAAFCTIRQGIQGGIRWELAVIESSPIEIPLQDYIVAQLISQWDTQTANKYSVNFITLHTGESYFVEEVLCAKPEAAPKGKDTWEIGTLVEWYNAACERNAGVASIDEIYAQALRLQCSGRYDGFVMPSDDFIRWAKRHVLEHYGTEGHWLDWKGNQLTPISNLRQAGIEPAKGAFAVWYKKSEEVDS